MLEDGGNLGTMELCVVSIEACVYVLYMLGIYIYDNIRVKFHIILCLLSILYNNKVKAPFQYILCYLYTCTCKHHVATVVIISHRSK